MKSSGALKGGSFTLRARAYLLCIPLFNLGGAQSLAAPRSPAPSLSREGLSGPLSALRRVTWRGESGERLELSATRAEWEDEARRVTLKGEVTLRRVTQGEPPLTLRCQRAVLLFERAEPDALSDASPALSSLRLTGSVQLSAPELKISANQLSWSAGGPLKIQGAFKGSWRAHQLSAEGAIFWPDSGRLELQGARAQIQLSPRRSRLQRARER